MIDAEAFVDEDGAAYLYWGSGHDWKNGRCWAVRLKPDMRSFDGEPADVTPGNYFEAPFLTKHEGRYYLMYSQGVTISDSYQVHYAIGTSPRGPFLEAPNSPVLVTDRSLDVVSPGHHAVFMREGKSYILYHRHSVPFAPEFIGRQVCVDELRFTHDGLIEKIRPTHQGPELIRRPPDVRLNSRAILSASSERDQFSAARHAIDGNNTTLWSADPKESESWLCMDLGETSAFYRQELCFEYAWRPYAFVIEASEDGNSWTTLADFSHEPVAGSPIVVKASGRARYLRLCFPYNASGPVAAMFEWAVFGR
jgi:beta-xylosidase